MQGSTLKSSTSWLELVHDPGPNPGCGLVQRFNPGLCPAPGATVAVLLSKLTQSFQGAQGTLRTWTSPQASFSR